jgi:hypothetical protein
MSKMIVRDLIEVGQQNSLFSSVGERPPRESRLGSLSSKQWMKRLREGDEGPATLRKSAAGSGDSSVAYKSRADLVDKLHEALDEEPTDHGRVRELHEALMDHDGVEHETYSHAGVGGPASESRIGWVMPGWVALNEARRRRPLPAKGDSKGWMRLLRGD